MGGLKEIKEGLITKSDAPKTGGVLIEKLTFWGGGLLESGVNRDFMVNL